MFPIPFSKALIGGALFLALAACIYGGVYQWKYRGALVKIAGLEIELTQVRSALKQAVAANDEMRVAIDQQNAAVMALKDAAEKSAKIYAAEKVKLEKRIVAANRRINDLLNAKPLDSDLCKSARLKFDQFILERRS